MKCTEGCPVIAAGLGIPGYKHFIQKDAAWHTFHNHF